MNKRLIGAMSLTVLLPTTPSVSADEIQELYDTKCGVCHAVGVADAPKLDDPAAWAPRLEKGTEGLLASVKNGLNAMPPMGTCTECTDEQLIALIESMTAVAK